MDFQAIWQKKYLTYKLAIDKIKKVPFIDQATGEYNLKYNIMNITEDFFLPVRGNDSGTSIDSLSGMEFSAIDDVTYLRDKLLASLRIPKAFLGYEGDLNSKCLHPDTKIPLLDGRTLTIKEIVDAFAENPNVELYCYSMDFTTNTVIPGKIKLAEKTRLNAQLVRVHLDNGTFVDTTPDHHYILKGGKEIEAQFLKEGDSMQTIYRRKYKLGNNANDYEQVYQPNTGKWNWTHKMVDNYFNGKLEKNGFNANGKFVRDELVVVHHDDFDRFNNHPKNLKRMTIYEHFKLHSENMQYGLLTEESIAKSIATKRLPENRLLSSIRQSKRIENNPELGLILRNSWLALTTDERSKIVTSGWKGDDTRKEAQSELCKQKDTKSNLARGYAEAFPDGRPDLAGENNWKYRTRPSIDFIISFINENKSIKDISTIFKLAIEMKYHKTILQEVIENNNYTVDEFMNYHLGFTSGRTKKLRLDNFIELSANCNSVKDFSEKYDIKRKGLKSLLEYHNLTEIDWSKNYLGACYNHKVVKVEFLDEKSDTYNMEVFDLSDNHNFLLDNDLVVKNSTLAQQDLRFSRTIERIQRIVISELKKIAQVHLYVLGYQDDDILNFELTLTNPSTIYEQEKVELLQAKVGLAQSMQDMKLFNQSWIYKNIFKLSDKDIETIQTNIIEDLKRKFRYDQIEQDGNDPKKSGQIVSRDKEKTLKNYDKEEDNITFGDNNFIHPLGLGDTGLSVEKNPLKTGGGLRHKFIGGSPLSTESKNALDKKLASKRNQKLLTEIEKEEENNDQNP